MIYMPPTSREATGHSPACRWCRSGLLQGARVCIECRRNQNPIIEHSRYLLTLSALLAALLSAIAYVSPTIESWVRTYLTPELKVNVFETESDKSVIENIGPSDVFIQYVTAKPAEFDGPIVHLSNFFHVVNRRLNHGEVLELDLESRHTKLQNRSLEPHFFDRMPLVPERIGKVLMERLKLGDPKVRIVVFGEDHPQLPIASELAAKASQLQESGVKATMLAYTYLCDVHFLHEYSRTLSPYTFACVGFIETTYSRLELTQMAVEATSPGTVSNPIDTSSAAPAAEE